MDSKKCDTLKLQNQICFPLYAASREVIKQYKPYLDEIDLTYTQYIALMLLWDRGTMTSKEMGDRLFLDSGTLTPLLKKLEAKGLITRVRSTKDERNLNISITEAGEALQYKAQHMAEEMQKYNPLSQEESVELYRLLYKMLKKEGVDAPEWADK